MSLRSFLLVIVIIVLPFFLKAQNAHTQSKKAEKYYTEALDSFDTFLSIANIRQNIKEDAELAWKVNINDIVKENEKGYVSVYLNIKNPNRKSEFEYQEPSKLIFSIVDREKKILK
ncbi:MAG: hypothetical protein PF484_14105 [Bacteroidales bacterium]|jgi:hypothetical protein|nr:hypothetical protein [Bacteroidales bacterium]